MNLMGQLELQNLTIDICYVNNSRIYYYMEYFNQMRIGIHRM